VIVPLQQTSEAGSGFQSGVISCPVQGVKYEEDGIFSVHPASFSPCVWREIVPQDIPLSFVNPAHLSLSEFRGVFLEIREQDPVEKGELAAHVSGQL